MWALTWARERLREKGLIDIVKVAVSVVLDSTFDWRYGTSPSGKVNSDQLGVTGGNQIHAKRYGATKVRPLLALLKSLDVARTVRRRRDGAGARQPSRVDRAIASKGLVDLRRAAPARCPRGGGDFSASVVGGNRRKRVPGLCERIALRCHFAEALARSGRAVLVTRLEGQPGVLSRATRSVH
jgi:hypothetical protein